MNGLVFEIQDLSRKSIGFWRTEGILPSVGDLIILGEQGYSKWRVKFVIWKAEDQDGAPYVEMRPFIIVEATGF